VPAHGNFMRAEVNNVAYMRLPLRNEPERVLFALAAAAETKAAYTKTHPKRVANTAVHIGMRLGLRESDLLADAPGQGERNI
jgi:HD-GYP domain-containing protein (c-di-GMP phosphodiesterase class II)